MNSPDITTWRNIQSGRRRFYVFMDTPEEAALWTEWTQRRLSVYDYVEFDLLSEPQT